MQKTIENTSWHTLSIDKVLALLETDLPNGLSEDEARRRLSLYGPNELTEKAGRTAWQILIEQFTSTMSLILTAAAILSGLVGSFKDAGTIFAIVIMFALLGFSQDYRAEKAIAALKKLAVPLVRARRNGVAIELPAMELTPGDILLLDAGSIAPADCRLIEAHGLKVQEALLTGESEAVEKHTNALTEADIPPGDRRNMLFMGTLISAGRAVAIVAATGMQTELGRIATLLQQVNQEWTPLQKRLDRLGKVLALVSVVIAVIIFILGVLRGEGFREMLLMAVSVAVAAIPEGLPAVVTITLALGAQRMLRRKALIRRLPAVETLGGVTVICSDKTGTLTRNIMTVTDLLSADQLQGGQASNYSEQGLKEPQRLLLVAGLICNDAVLKIEDNQELILGDPTEGALVKAAATGSLLREDLEQIFPRIAEIPFDSVTKRMITTHRISSDSSNFLPIEGFDTSDRLLAAKGALDSILELCSHILLDGKQVMLTERHKNIVQHSADKLSDNGKRVLAFSIRLLSTESDNPLEEYLHGFTFIGLTALEDPPRPEAGEAVQRCLSAGIRPVMITGDHPLTARAIARQVGIDDSAGALTGVELDRLTPQDFDNAVNRVSVYARVAPEHKLMIVDAIQRNGGVAAMTGDGVNDAPALKKADVGVAMGKVGTDVAREASDMVLLDDNFATIVAAVEEGRTIYDNIRKFVVFSVAGNTGKILAVLLLPFAGLNMPLTPLQLLWLNLLTDGLLGLGMGVERPEPDVMKRPPIASDSQIFDRQTIYYVLITGLLIGTSCMTVSLLIWKSGGPWQTVLFASLALAQVAQAMSLRSFRSSFFSLGLFTNPLLLAMALCVVLLQGLVIYMPALQTFFRTTFLSANQLLLVALPAIAVFILLEGKKILMRAEKKTRQIVG